MLRYQDAVNLLDGEAAAKSSSLEPNELIQLSIAISLKRIADIMDGSCKEYTPLDKIAAAAIIYKDNNENSY